MLLTDAFLTKANTVGMKFIEKDKSFVIWKDKKGRIHYSEEATPQQKAAMLIKYTSLYNRYMSKKG